MTYREEDLDSLINIVSAKEITNLLGVAMDLEIFPSLKGKALSLAEASQTWKLQTSSTRALAQGLCYLKFRRRLDGEQLDGRRSSLRRKWSAGKMWLATNLRRNGKTIAGRGFCPDQQGTQASYR